MELTRELTEKINPEALEKRWELRFRERGRNVFDGIEPGRTFTHFSVLLRNP
jgi:hypothetical protein